MANIAHMRAAKRNVPTTEFDCMSDISGNTRYEWRNLMMFIAAHVDHPDLQTALHNLSQFQPDKDIVPKMYLSELRGFTKVVRVAAAIVEKEEFSFAIGVPIGNALELAFRRDGRPATTRITAADFAFAWRAFGELTLRPSKEEASSHSIWRAYALRLVTALEFEVVPEEAPHPMRNSKEWLEYERALRKVKEVERANMKKGKEMEEKMAWVGDDMKATLPTFPPPDSDHDDEGTMDYSEIIVYEYTSDTSEILNASPLDFSGSKALKRKARNVDEEDDLSFDDQVVDFKRRALKFGKWSG